MLAVNGDREILSSIGLENPENEKCVEKGFEEVSLDEMERRYISWLLKRHSGNKSETARVLKISKSTLYEKMKRWESFEGDNDPS